MLWPKRTSARADRVKRRSKCFYHVARSQQILLRNIAKVLSGTDNQRIAK